MIRQGWISPTHPVSMKDMLRIGAIPILGDNYVWVLSRPDSSHVIVVDPGEAGPVLDWLEEHELEPSTILITHRHHDHVGGVEEIARRFSPRVVAPKRDSVPAASESVVGGDIIRDQSAGVELTTLDVPGHTAGHAAYVGHGIALTGDALFAGGCGRVFEGTFDQMYESLQRLAALPTETAIHCAHEYTVSNLRFAREVEPENEVLQSRLKDAEMQRELGGNTLPSTIAEELATNPFLRCEAPAVVDAARARSGSDLAPGAEVFAVLRHWKDGWSG